MDIARIRKRLKEAGEGQKLQKSEPFSPDAVLTTKPTEAQVAEYEEISEHKDDIKPAMLEKSTNQDEIKHENIADGGSVSNRGTQPEDDLQQTLGLIELLTFKLSGEEYAFRVSDVQEILLPHHITKVPRTNPCVLGVISMRGKVIPVIDLKRRFFDVTNGPVSKILILKGPKGSIGVTVDRGMDVIRVPESDITEPPSHLTGEEIGFIEGMASYRDRFISVVRMDGLLDFNFKAAPEG